MIAPQAGKPHGEVIMQDESPHGNAGDEQENDDTKEQKNQQSQEDVPGIGAGDVLLWEKIKGRIILWLS